MSMIPTPRNKRIDIEEPYQPKETPSRQTTDHRLHEGPEPSHIDRQLSERVAGYNAPRGVSGNGQADANQRYVGHVPLVHRVTPPAPSYGAHTVDDTAYIPAVMAGNPVQSP